jgi:hypothetical protein
MKKLIKIYINTVFRDTIKRNNERLERNMMSKEVKGPGTAVILLVSCRTKG